MLLLTQQLLLIAVFVNRHVSTSKAATATSVL
jgi:hypothetical protein